MKKQLIQFLAVSAFAAALPLQAGAATEQSSTRPTHKVEPEFPFEAQKAGVQRGKVTARMTLDATGRVTYVEIVDAQPRRIFDRAVVRALSEWRYAEGAAGRVVEIDVAFKQ
jgi:periplasmic protein TonB